MLGVVYSGVLVFSYFQGVCAIGSFPIAIGTPASRSLYCYRKLIIEMVKS